MKAVELISYYAATFHA